jgi:hypothetical protein
VVIQFGATRYEIKLIGGEGNLDQVPPEVKRLSPGEFLIALKDEGGAPISIYRSLPLNLRAKEEGRILRSGL